MRLTGIICQAAGGLAVVLALVLACDLLMHLPRDFSEPKVHQCLVNVGYEIGMGMRTWGLRHHNQYPFNVSTNEGGTLELCARDSEGFDSNAWRHFQVLSNELGDPTFLVCPNDHKHKPARDFQSLGPKNVSYRLRTGPSLTETNGIEVLLVCPTDGNTVYSDVHWNDSPRSPQPAYRYATTFRQGLGQVLISLGAAALLIGLGSHLRLKRPPTV